MHDTVYIVVTAKGNEYVGVYATRERAEYMIRNSGMREGTYQVIAQTPVWDKQMKIQNLREVFKVTEWREGCVYRTKSVGYAWVTDGYTPSEYEPNTQIHSLPTAITRKLEYRTSRTVADETADLIMTEV